MLVSWIAWLIWFIGFEVKDKLIDSKEVVCDNIANKHVVWKVEDHSPLYRLQASNVYSSSETIPQLANFKVFNQTWEPHEYSDFTKINSCMCFVSLDMITLDLRISLSSHHKSSLINNFCATVACIRSQKPSQTWNVHKQTILLDKTRNA